MLRTFFFLGILNTGALYGQTIDSLDLLKTSKKDSLKESRYSVLQMEERWQNTLFANDLFVALTDSIANQSFEAVYYPELPTDTLKKRLAILDAKTPLSFKIPK